MKSWGLGLVAMVSALVASADDFDVSRAALRDGLWDVARAHALRVNNESAKLVVLETYAREENWRGLLAAYDAMGYPSGEGFAYYRALALFKDGSVASSSNVLAGVKFSTPDFVRPAARLRAEIALADGQSDRALAILKEAGGDDVETRMMIASIRAGGGGGESERLWRTVLADTNATESMRATAATGLRDVAALRQLLSTAQTAAVRRFAALRLGVILLDEAQTFAEGEKLIRETVRDQPDAEGARSAFCALAETLFAHGKWTEAEKTYADTLTIWPDAAKDAVLQEGRGAVLARLGRTAEALEAFRRAEELYAEVERKAASAVRAADVLAAAGRGDEATTAYQRVCDAYRDTMAAVRVADLVRLREKEKSGRALYRAFKFDEARKVFASLAQEDPSRREWLSFYDVLCAYGAGDDESAEATARSLAEGANDAAVRAEATHWLAKFFYNRGRWPEAGRLFLAFAELRPDAPSAPMALVWAARAALADNDFQNVIGTVAKLLAKYPESPARAAGMLAQGEALIELGRFDEAVLVLDRASLVTGVSDDVRLKSRILRADALFAMGADNPARYVAALDAYNAIRTGEALSPGAELSVSFKVAKTLEKLKRVDEAIDAYYTQVVLAYRTGRLAGTHYDDAARATFARAAFRLADEYESRGRIRQAIHVLDLVRTSDVKASGEAVNRIDRMTKKGVFP